MRKKRESGKDLTMSSTPARFLSAGAEKRPLKRDRPAKERNLTEPFQPISEGRLTLRRRHLPTGSLESAKNSSKIVINSKGPLDYAES